METTYVITILLKVSKLLFAMYINELPPTVIWIFLKIEFYIVKLLLFDSTN